MGLLPVGGRGEAAPYSGSWPLPFPLPRTLYSRLYPRLQVSVLMPHQRGSLATLAKVVIHSPLDSTFPVLVYFHWTLFDYLFIIYHPPQPEY